jgi:aminoglycoside 6'-N-acetyltransferase I
MTHDILIRRSAAPDLDDWLRMRQLLWPYSDPGQLRTEMERMLGNPLEPAFVAVRPDGSLGGFIEAGLRKYADGCSTSPVGYIEGWYVDEDLRRQGVGATLVRAAEEWAREQGCTEMASDTWLDNDPSISAHRSLGYEECERLVHFCKTL